MIKNIKWRRFLIIASVVVVGFFACIMALRKLNWRVFVLHDSERVTIKVR